jgi:hypothetical protein
MISDKKNELNSVKREIIYEDDDCISIWRYNSKITSFGPVDVEYKYKRGYVFSGTKQSLGQLVKKQKKTKGGQ